MSSLAFQPAPAEAVIDYAAPSTQSLPQARSDAAASAGVLVRYRLWVLLGITLLGTVMRFSFITKPPLWGDEAYTYSRVCGEFQEMLDVLQFDGFPPLHYELYWLIRQFTPLTPVTMRIVPAIAGTLMIPAMYFLAVQITRRRTALLVALFTCVSAYMMVYSRDAKMYMWCWLFVALNFGCFFCWLRTGARIAWLAWVATGVAAGGFQMVALAAIGIQPIILLTQQWRQWRWGQPILLLLGLLIISAGPVGYKLGFNKWGQHVEEVGFTAGSGVGWVESYNRDRSGPDLALFAATAHLFSWEWPSHVTQMTKPGIAPDTMRGLMIAGVVVLLLLAIGAIPWRTRVGSALADGTLGKPDLITTSEIPSAKADPTDSESSSDDPAQSWWRQALWLSLWIMLPAYALYCQSMRDFASPADWITSIGDLFEQHWLAIGIGVLALIALSEYWRALPRYLIATILIAGVVLLGAILLNSGLTQLFGKDQWAAAYWPILSRWWEIASDLRVVVGVIGVLPVVAWHFSGRSIAERARKAGQMALVAGGIFIACVGVYRAHVWYVESEARKITADYQNDAQWKMMVALAKGDHGVPPRAMVLQRVQAESPGLSRVLTEKRADERIAAKQRRWDELIARFTKKDPSLQKETAQKDAEQKAAEQIGSERMVWDRWVSKWMPRYLGMCWPAVAIAACALLVRVPTRPLRYIAIALFLALNVGQATARVFAGSEPPMDRIVKDIAAAQDHPAAITTTRTYLDQMASRTIGHPGTLAVFGQQGHYYLAQITDAKMDPRTFRSFGMPPSGSIWEPWKLRIVYDLPAAAILNDLHQAPQTTRVIFWERAEKPTSPGPCDTVMAALGPEWKPVGKPEIFYGRMHWDWRDLYTVRRREFVREPPPTPMLATQPATQPSPSR